MKWIQRLARGLELFTSHMYFNEIFVCQINKKCFIPDSFEISRAIISMLQCCSTAVYLTNNELSRKYFKFKKVMRFYETKGNSCYIDVVVLRN